MKDFDYPEAKKRDLLICECISEHSIKAVIESIFEINNDDAQKEKIFRDWKREPIRLFINSLGGSVYYGLALVDIIKQSKTPVHTICIGSCMSMALWVWMAGQQRFIGENSTLMFHDLSCFTYNTTEGIKQELSELTRLQVALVEEIVSNSMVKEEVIRDYITRKADWFIPAKEAVSLKLASGFYK